MSGPTIRTFVTALLDSGLLATNATYDHNATMEVTLTPTTMTTTTTSQPHPEYVDFRERSRFWIQRVLVPLIMTIGVIGNTITIIILTRRRMRSSTNCYLAALAIFDMLYLVLTFILSLKHYPNIENMQFYHYWKCFGLLLMLTDACSNTSVWLTVTFTIERYIAVCHPIKRKVICTEHRAKKVIFAVFVLCFSFTITTPFEWTVETDVNPSTNKTVVFATYSKFGRNFLYRNIYYWVTVVLFTFLPCILLAVFNSFLIWAVHQSKSQRKLMTMTKTQRDSATQENKITIMLIAVVMLFLICQLPSAVMLVYSVTNIYSKESNYHALLTGLNNIFNFLMAVNASCNFVLYCVLSEKYRRTFHKVFCPCTHQERFGQSGVMNTTVVDYEMSSTSPSFGRRRSSATAYGARATNNERKASAAGRRPDLLLHEKTNFLTVPGKRSVDVKLKGPACANHRANGNGRCIVATVDECSSLTTNRKQGKMGRFLSQLKIPWTSRAKRDETNSGSDVSETNLISDVSKQDTIVTTGGADSDEALTSI